MGYRTVLEKKPETVQDLQIAARHRLKEARVLFSSGEYHAAIYLAGLSAEMLLKTACFVLDNAAPGDAVEPLRSAARRRSATPHLYESGHGLWFWFKECLHRRRVYSLKSPPKRFRQYCASISLDWFNEMRYRPGFAGRDMAARFISQVEWILMNHAKIRR